MKSMRLLLIMIIFFYCYAIEFVNDELVKQVEQKYGFFAKKRFEKLKQLISDLQNADILKKIESVNDFFNNISYSSDMDTYGVTDYWATPSEFLAKGEGDCEDYAIAKYFLLKHLGIDSNKMFITYVSVSSYTQAHMVLTYFEIVNSEPLVLDNFNEKLLPASKRDDLKPIYYFNPELLNDGMKTIAHKKWDELIKHMMENKI